MSYNHVLIWNMIPFVNRELKLSQQICLRVWYRLITIHTKCRCLVPP